MLVGAFGAGAALLALRDHFDVLFVDDWRILDHYASRGLLQYLFGSENGHRLPLTLALFAIDYEWLGGRMRLLVLASIACMALTAGLLWRAFRRDGALGNALGTGALGFACFCLFWAASCNDLLRGLYQMNLQAVALAVFALGALARVDPSRIRNGRWELGLALLASLLATLSQAAGAASWAALVAVAVVRRFPWRIVGGLAATGAAVMGIFAATQPPHPKISFGDSLAFATERPFVLAGYTLAFVGAAPARVAIGLGLGAPVPGSPKRTAWREHTRDLGRIAVGFGAAGAAIFLCVAVRRRLRSGPSAALDDLSVGLMAFGLAAALLVAFARAVIAGPAAVVQPRFVTWSTLFWIGAACALVPRAGRRAAAPLAWIAVLAFPLASLGMLPALREAREFHATTRSQAARLTLSLLLGLRQDELARNVSLEDAELVYRVASRLESEGRWPFQGPLFRLRGAALGDRFSTAEPCTGGVDRVRAIGSIGSAAVSGWIARTRGAESLRFVVLADTARIVRGIADPASVPPRHAEGLGERRVGWTGFISDYDPAQRYVAYAVLGDPGSACPLRAP
jgi:hypothetical protein